MEEGAQWAVVHGVTESGATEATKHARTPVRKMSIR